MSKSIEFVVVFWGRKYREFFTRFCLPSLVSPNNVPAFSRPDVGVTGRLIIASTQEDYTAATQDPLFALLSQHVEVEFIDIGSPGRGVDAQIHMSQGHKYALYRIMERKSFGSFLAPDIILADGSIATLIKYVAAGHRRILFPALRFDLDKSVAGLTAMGALKPGEPLNVSPRDLAKIATTSLHSELRRFEYDSDHFSDYPISIVFSDPGRGLLIHTSSYGVACDFSELEGFDARRHFDEDTMDAHFIDAYIYGSPDLVLLNDTDEFFMLPLTSEEDMPQEYLIRPDPYLVENRKAAQERKITYIRRFLFSAASDAFKRWVIRKPARIHYADLPRDDRAAERALGIVNRALRINDLPKPVHFVTAVSGHHAISIFLTFCLPSLCAPGNLPQLAGIVGCRLLIVTTRKDREFLESYGLVHFAASFVSIDYFEVDHEAAAQFGDGLDRAACIAAAKRSFGQNAFVGFIDPFSIVSDGTIGKLIDFAIAGRGAVVAPAPYYDQQGLWELLDRNGFLSPLEPIQMDPRELAQCTLAELHSDFRRGNWDNPGAPNLMSGLYLEAPGGLVMHTGRWAVLLADLTRLNASATTGADIENELCRIHEEGRMHCVTDSDEINLVTLKPDPGMPAPGTTAQFAPYWKRETILAEHLERQSKLTRLLFGLAVRLHVHGLTPMWDRVEGRTNALVRDALSGVVSLDKDEAEQLEHGRSVFETGYRRLNADGTVWVPSPVQQTTIPGMGIMPVPMMLKLLVSDPAFRKIVITRAAKDPRWLADRILFRLRRMLSA